MLPNEIVLQELVDFLDQHYIQGGDSRLLDAGAGSRPYGPVYGRYFHDVCAFDVQRAPTGVPPVDVIASAEALPFPAASFDCVLMTEVLEHLRNPGRALAECCRVLRPGGRLFLTTPFFVPLHELPHDYYRFTPFGLQHLSEQAGLRVESIVTKGGFWAFALLFTQFPWVRLWMKLAASLPQGVLDVRNPLFHLLITMPQLMYVAFWKRERRKRPAAGDSAGLAARTPLTLGYITTLKRPDRDAASPG